jgi:hypothetical protein
MVSEAPPHRPARDPRHRGASSGTILAEVS